MVVGREIGLSVLFPCPLKEKYFTKDPTAWIDTAQTEKIAISLAHGNVEGIANGEPDYPIPRDAPVRLGLDFLALGHWHPFARFDDNCGVCRMAYAGTHGATPKPSGRPRVLCTSIPFPKASPKTFALLSECS